MAPIRVGLVGLSTSVNPRAPGGWTSAAHLPALLASPYYEIVALANSTVQSAEASIAHHHLKSEVKAYGSPEDLAKDPNVDLVVISVNVGKHYKLAKPALLAGKDVFVEWPLGASTAEAEELTGIARSKGQKTVVGLQTRADPLWAKVVELIDSGKIGQVLDSHASIVSSLPAGTFPVGAEYYLDMESGGNSLMITFGHFIDNFRRVLGEFTSLQSILKIHHKSVNLVDLDGNVITPDFPKNTPDSIVVQGTVASGAVVSVHFRAGKSVDGIGLRLVISGTSGEIEITVPEIVWSIGSAGATLRLREGDRETEEIDFLPKELGISKELPLIAANVARLYEAFRLDDTSKYATFEDALATHHTLDAVRKGKME